MGIQEIDNLNEYFGKVINILKEDDDRISVIIDSTDYRDKFMERK
jgi:hypothetical protein